MSINFYNTRGGRRFVDDTVPRGVAALERMADGLARCAEALESLATPLVLTTQPGDTPLAAKKHDVEALTFLQAELESLKNRLNAAEGDDLGLLRDQALAQFATNLEKFLEGQNNA